VKLSSWPEIGSDGDVLLTPYVPKGITGYDDDDDDIYIYTHRGADYIYIHTYIHTGVLIIP
jgi:hypothetical protein